MVRDELSRRRFLESASVLALRAALPGPGTTSTPSPVAGLKVRGGRKLEQKGWDHFRR